MRNVIVLTFLTLDGVMQAPGGPGEDTSGDFKYGGWTVPYSDEVSGKMMGEQMGRPFDLLLGRKTFDIFAGYWPQHDNEIGAPINNATKYVASKTVENHSWQKSVFMKGDVAGQIQQIKQGVGPDLFVFGSGILVQTLMTNDLIDEFWLKIYPITLGQGKRLFDKGSMPQAFTLTESHVTPRGVIFANYKRGGDVETGSF